MKTAPSATLRNDAFWIKGGGEFTLEGVKTDFVGRHMLRIGPLSPVEFKYVSGHIEGIQGRTVFKDAPQSYSQSTVPHWQSCEEGRKENACWPGALEVLWHLSGIRVSEFDLRSVSESHRRIAYVWPGGDQTQHALPPRWRGRRVTPAYI